MDICFFLNKLVEKKYSKNINAYNLIQNLYNFFGFKYKKYIKQIAKNEEFNIFLYSSKISKINLKATFNEINILNIVKPNFIKKLVHNFIEFPHIIPSKMFVYCFDLPLPKLFFKNKIILELSNLAPFIHQDFFSKKPKINSIINSMKRADHIIVHTEYMKEALITKLFSNKDKISILPKGIEACFYSKHSVADFENIKNKFKLNNDYIIFSGKLSRYKNLERLCHSFIDLKIPKLDLIIAGTFNQDYDTYKNNIKYYNYINKLTKENSNIKLLSHINQNELAILLFKAKALVEPSFYNDFPDTIVEAYASNTKVIASNIPAHTKFIKDSDFLFSPYSKEDIKKAIINVLNKEQTITNVDNYKWENVIIAYSSYLKSLK